MSGGVISAGARGRRSRVRYRNTESYINLNTMTSKEGTGDPDHISLEGGGPAHNTQVRYRPMVPRPRGAPPPPPGGHPFHSHQTLCTRLDYSV